jgi:hypothetical protein
VVTSFDGNFSVRVFVRKNDSSTLHGFLQIRHNTQNNVVIIWNGLTSKTSLSGTAGNQFKLGAAQTWSSGNWGTSEFSVAEQRSYIWTTADVTDKTVYHLTLMVATPDSNNAKEKTNIFLKIEQIHAN